MGKLTNAEKSARYRAKDVEAYRKKKREFATTPEQREVRRLYMREWVAKNREKVNEAARERSKKNKEYRTTYSRNRRLVVKFGITYEEKVAMVKSQDGKCAICKTDFWSDRSTHLDHSHSTGRIRGILCHVCNTKLGWYESNKEMIDKYLSTDTVY